MSQKQQLRRRMRAMRQTLSAADQATAAKRLNQQLINSQLLEPATKIALYLATEGEINLAQVLHRLWTQGKQCYLPILPASGKQLRFGHYSRHTPLKANRYGIDEPITDQQLTAAELDAVLLPLVAFDDQGHRLGMGGGYYDSSFAGLADQVLLIGCAHEKQKLETLPVDSWDIPLNAIITDQTVYKF